MNKSVDEINFPTSDLDCWNRYNRHRWVYELTRLLDSQNIPWSLNETDTYSFEVKNLQIGNTNADLGTIFISPPTGNRIVSETLIFKGEVKKILHQINDDIDQELIGDVEIKINAFAQIYFSKFSGIITTEIIGKNIYRISLKSQSDLHDINDREITKLIKKIYK